MASIRKALFIINKFSGTGYTPELEQHIIQISNRFSAEAILEFTKGPGHATELAASGKLLGADAVVAVGGDGTINEVAKGLAGGGIPMGIVARGSGNGLARHLAIPLVAAHAVETLYTGEVLLMDTFSFNDKLSLNVSGIGFDGHIANLFAGTKKRGLSGYAKIAVTEFFKFRPFNATVTIGDKTETTKAFILAIANSSQYGNNAWVAPGASVSDGLLDLNILKKVPLYRFDFLYDFVTKALQRSPFCDLRTIAEARITTEEAMPYHVDGEPCGSANEFVIKVNPATLPVIAPRGNSKIQKF